MPWADNAAVVSCISSGFASWSASEAAIVRWTGHLRKSSSCRWILSLLYWAADEMQEAEVCSVLGSLMRPIGISALELDRLAASLKSHRAVVLSESCGSDAHLPLLVFVDSEIAQFPLEACPCLRQLEVVRGVSANVSLAAFQRHRRSPEATTVVCANPSSSAKSVIHQLQDACSSALCKDLPQTGFFVLDPEQRASCAQTQLRRLLHSWTTSPEHGTWSGCIGRPFPESNELLEKMVSKDVFLYMGHGQCAKKLLRADALQMGAPVAPRVEQPGPVNSKRVPLHSIVMLMGCSTAKISRQTLVPKSSRADAPAHGRHGIKACAGSNFEAFGMPLNVLIGGAPVMVGALWDVLGGDLEQLVCSLLQNWLPSPDSPTQSASAGSTSNSLTRSLLKARQACRLSFLTGAAVVVYGIPI